MPLGVQKTLYEVMKSVILLWIKYSRISIGASVMYVSVLPFKLVSLTF
jgi:hypothetical protein